MIFVPNIRIYISVRHLANIAQTGEKCKMFPIRASQPSVSTDQDPSKWMAHIPVGYQPSTQAY